MALFQSYARYRYGRWGPLKVLNFWWYIFLFHMITRDSDDSHSWPVPNVQHNTSYISPKELTGNPEAGSILCHSPLRPVYDRVVSQKNHPSKNTQKIPCLNEVKMCTGMSTRSTLSTHPLFFHLAYYNKLTTVGYTLLLAILARFVREHGKMEIGPPPTFLLFL